MCESEKCGGHSWKNKTLHHKQKHVNQSTQNHITNKIKKDSSSCTARTSKTPGTNSPNSSPAIHDFTENQNPTNPPVHWIHGIIKTNRALISNRSSIVEKHKHWHSISYHKVKFIKGKKKSWKSKSLPETEASGERCTSFKMEYRL